MSSANKKKGAHVKTHAILMTALLAAGFAPQAQAQAQAQTPTKEEPVKVNLLFIGWYTQMVNNNCRLNSESPYPYFKTGGTTGAGSQHPYKENTFSIRRCEISLAGRITDQLTGNVVIDPNISDPILWDAFITWKPNATFEVKMGQYKPIGYEATLVAAADLLFTDRGQLARLVTDGRQRGIMASANMGDQDFGGKLGLGVYNGSADRNNDKNAQKDLIARADFQSGKLHRFGAYALHGRTDLADKTDLTNQGSVFGAGPGIPTAQKIHENRDKTTTYGAYYAFDKDKWHADAEVATGTLGRFFPTFNQSAPKRQHLDQKFLSVSVVGAYKMENHLFRLRYDHMNFNQGDKWYGAQNPYKLVHGDFTPKHTEITAGYTYAFNPDSVRKANVKLDYIWRTKNFLHPRADQSGEQGGDSVVMAVQFCL